MEPDSRNESRTTGILRTLGYIYSVGVFATATGLAAQYYLGYMDVGDRRPATAGAARPNGGRETELENKTNLHAAPETPAEANAPGAISRERGRAPASAPSGIKGAADANAPELRRVTGT